MRVLVTGAKGYIAQALVPALEAAGHAVTAPREMRHADVTDPVALEVAGMLAQLRYPKPDQAIVHLACKTDGDWRANIAGTVNALTVLPRHGRFVFASSIAAPASRDQYEAEKLLGEQIVLARPDITPVVLRLANVFGPGHQSRRCVLNHIIRQAVQGQPIALYDDAAGVRDYVYVDDVVRAFVRALDPDVPPGTYDVGTGAASSLLGAADEACRQTGHAWPTKDGSLTYGHAPLAQESRWLPGWRPTVALREGIARTIAWLREHEPVAEREAVAA